MAMGMPGVNRDELARFLRARRDRLRPADVGLPDGGRRRTPGLRRQEVAQLAGISIDYYIRLEQARGPRPSKQVLGALGRALMLSVDEREYLFRIAGEAPPSAAGPSRTVPDGVLNMLQSLDTPGYVLDATYELLATNRLAEFFVGNPVDGTIPERNVIRQLFRAGDDDERWDDPRRVCFAQACVADLRAAMARYPGYHKIQSLVDELLASSQRFAEMWADHHVEVRRGMVKQVDHPLVGPLELDCEVLHVPDSDQRIIVYTAPHGSPTWRALRRLAELAVQSPASLCAVDDTAAQMEGQAQPSASSPTALGPDRGDGTPVAGHPGEPASVPSQPQQRRD